MLRLCFLLLFAWPVFPWMFRATIQEEPGDAPSLVEVHSPQPGQALQGLVPVNADLLEDGVQVIEISFTYAGDEHDTWYLIDEIPEPSTSEELATWDTTVLTDGIYTLRLSIRMEDGSLENFEVNDLRVRNYTPVETNTPAPHVTDGQGEAVESTTEQQYPAAALTATQPAFPGPVVGVFGSFATPSPEPLPANPAQVSYQDVVGSLGKGGLAAVAGFLLFGIYRWVRQLKRNRKNFL